MNYLAHARHVLGDPWHLAGTALPDWIAVATPKNKVRRASDLTSPKPGSPASAARDGILRHFADDAWFHEDSEFLELCRRAAIALREAASPGQESDSRPFRASFIGHVLVEMLVDAELSGLRPSALTAYYAALDGLDLHEVAAVAAELHPGADSARLHTVLGRFRESRFLEDYSSDSLLSERLSAVARRAGLDALHLPQIVPVVRQFRAEVAPLTRAVLEHRVTPH